MSKRWMLALAVVLTSQAQATQHKDPASGCAVSAPAYLASSDYVFSYQGVCRDGLAEGQGKAIWTLKNSPSHREEWAGRFSAGVYLPEPAQGLKARALRGDNVLFDLGPLPKLEGMSPRLAVEATSELTKYPDPCKPDTLFVLQADGPALVSDDVAKRMLSSALDKLKLRCGDDRLRERGRPGGERSHVRVRMVPQTDLEFDPYGNPKGIVVEATLPLDAGKDFSQYSNSVASQQRQRQAREERDALKQANAQRLQAFAKPTGASLWVGLNALAQNPFRYQDQIVLTAVRLNEVVAPTRARVMAVGGGYQSSFALVEGEGLAKWEPGARVLAVRVLGRLPNTDAALPAGLHLQLVGQLPCALGDCSDRLSLPNPLRDGEALP
ncbi:hypothetical protein [Roseateles asaccharophilus]|uniref:Uncharacterized protein n=1 Tax=Roseateles asaccharophilus TaxID=582607 RepID=A0ABU2ABS2_9BURK|nr:hypothetical protein [Roseateles asaccharophilus]MDR7334646.1 hypothetical protein [Roseateles asaccharophilus]